MVQKQEGYNRKNVSTKYRFALYGVDCADYCPEVCQFQFMNGSGCDSKFVSYELHGNPDGYIRNTAQFKYYMHWVWNHTIPTWTHIHINNAQCKIDLGVPNADKPQNTDWSDTFTGAGCKTIPEKYQKPIVVGSKEVCLQAETFYKKTNQDATLDGSHDTMEGGTHHGGR